MRVIAVINQKGGVGKTTTTYNLGAAIANAGQRVLFIDLDPQSNLTLAVGITEEEVSKSINDVLLQECTISDGIMKVRNFHICPAHLDLCSINSKMNLTVGREQVLKEALISVQDQFDYVLIDCPPSLDILTLSAMTASFDVIIPLQAEYFSLAGLNTLNKTINSVRTRVNPELRILGAVIVLYDGRKSIHQQNAEKLQEIYKDVIFKTKIRHTTSLAEACQNNADIFSFKPKSYGADDYKALAREVIARIGEKDFIGV